MSDSDHEDLGESDDDVGAGTGGAENGGEPTPSYSSNEYWDKRYAKDPNTFDWYQNWTGMKYFFTPYINSASRVLMIGCGTSELTEDLYEFGVKDIVNVDISSVAIELMRKKHADKPTLKWCVADVMSLSTGSSAAEFGTASYDAVIDKGTLDALLCGKDGDRHARNALAEMARVLKPGGAILYVTYGAPPSRTRYLSSSKLPLTLLPTITIPQKHSRECTCGGCEDGKGNTKVQPQPNSFKPLDSKFADALATGSAAANGSSVVSTSDSVSARRIAEAAQWNDEEFHFLYIAIKTKLPAVVTEAQLLAEAKLTAAAAATASAVTPQKASAAAPSPKPTTTPPSPQIPTVATAAAALANVPPPPSAVAPKKQAK